MSANLLPVQPVTSKSFTMRDLPITRANIDSALETLWTLERFSPTFMMLSTVRAIVDHPHDHESLNKEIFEWLHGGIEAVEESLKKLTLDSYHNPATGQVMHVYGSTYIQPGIVVFGSIAIDKVTK